MLSSHKGKFLLPSGRTFVRLNMKSVFHCKWQRKSGAARRKAFIVKCLMRHFMIEFYNHFSIFLHSLSQLCLSFTTDLKPTRAKPNDKATTWTSKKHEKLLLNKKKIFLNFSFSFLPRRKTFEFWWIIKRSQLISMLWTLSVFFLAERFARLIFMLFRQNFSSTSLPPKTLIIHAVRRKVFMQLQSTFSASCYSDISMTRASFAVENFSYQLRAWKMY